MQHIKHNNTYYIAPAILAGVMFVLTLIIFIV
jgi:hypothetical protein